MYPGRVQPAGVVRSKQGKARVRPGFARDLEDAKKFFRNGQVSYSATKRIHWRKSNVFDELMGRQGGQCLWCRQPMNPKDYTVQDANRVVGPDYPTFEHLVALKLGGRDHPSNLAMSHSHCNRERDQGGFGGPKSALLGEKIRAHVSGCQGDQDRD